MKHQWRLRQDGTPDVWAWESEFHNGVYCERCGKTVCIHCHDDWEEMDDCVENKIKSQTNADHIRSMSDEELATSDLLSCPYRKYLHDECKFGWCMREQTCEECILEWLKQPADMRKVENE